MLKNITLVSLMTCLISSAAVSSMEPDGLKNSTIKIQTADGHRFRVPAEILGFSKIWRNLLDKPVNLVKVFGNKPMLLENVDVTEFIYIRTLLEELEENGRADISRFTLGELAMVIAKAYKLEISVLFKNMAEFFLKKLLFKNANNSLDATIFSKFRFSAELERLLAQQLLCLSATNNQPCKKQEFKTSMHQITVFRFLVNNRTLALSSLKDGLCAFDAVTAELFNRDFGEGDNRSHYAGNGKIAHIKGCVLKIADVFTKDLQLTFKAEQEIRDILFSPDYNWLAVYIGHEWEDKIVLYDLLKCKEIATITPGFLIDSCFTANSKQFVTSALSWDGSDSDDQVIKSVKAWNLLDTKCQPTSLLCEKRASENFSLCLNGYGNTVVITNTFAHTLFFWNAKNGKLRREIAVGNKINALQFSANGKYMAIGIGNETQIYDEEKLLWTVPGSIGLNSASSAFSSDSKLVATACADGSVPVWHLKTGKKIIELDGNESEKVKVLCICFSADAKRLAVATVALFANDDPLSLTVRCWDLDDTRLDALRSNNLTLKKALTLAQCTSS